MDEQRRYECEKCGEAYNEEDAKSYGRYVEIPGGAEWRCHACITDKKPKEKSS